MDTVSGSTRFTFGVTELMDGVGLVPLVMGLFGISEIILNLEQHDRPRRLQDQGQGAAADPGGLDPGQVGASCGAP